MVSLLLEIEVEIEVGNFGTSATDLVEVFVLILGFSLAYWLLVQFDKIKQTSLPFQ